MEETSIQGNRRGRRSRQEILDAAARVMAARGYAGTAMSALVEATGLPKSAIYHHFESKAGLLSEVMARGARAFFDAMREAHREPPVGGSPRERLGWYLQKTGEVFMHHQDFLRLQLVLVMSNEAAEAPHAMQTVMQVRAEGRDYMRLMIASAFSGEGEETAAHVGEQLEHFGMVGFDGSFVSIQTGDRRTMHQHMEQLTQAMALIGEAAVAQWRARPSKPARQRGAR
ncbi:TetR/AcrR family transcriptional regulator [Variovorax sp. Sphag1AA]|uniref:TetR/AcrR family transcriptional regulator n=1 Tax=Variovorax sp. Sphag1AA TaxID=2587027 RepID=UPI00161A55B9|nr:TetR/AcrR family transcriptional regulator [Variovorax sp. Sphag1AA]MBB3181671.1 AcrR family transcriptional regulator [Variovorax sp. Sphag1AA]